MFYVFLRTILVLNLADNVNNQALCWVCYPLFHRTFRTLGIYFDCQNVDISSQGPSSESYTTTYTAILIPLLTPRRKAFARNIKFCCIVAGSERTYNFRVLFYFAWIYLTAFNTPFLRSFYIFIHTFTHSPQYGYSMTALCAQAIYVLSWMRYMVINIRVLRSIVCSSFLVQSHNSCPISHNQHRS